MPYKSRWSIPIPDCSLPTFLFTSPSTDLGEKPCFLNASCPEERYFTRNSFRLWSQRFALGLHRSPGFKSGDRILVYSGNTLAFPVAFMGSLMAGGIFTGANPTFVARELANQLKDSGASYLLCVDDSLDTGIDAANLIGMEKSRIFVFNANVFEKSNQGQSAIKGCKYWGELIASAEDARDFQWEDLKRPGECHKTLALNYSSGTTGVPKGVEVTHYNYVSNTLQYNHLPTLWPDYKDRAAKCRWLCFLPMYHAMAQTIYLAGGLLRHIPVYIMPKFDFIAVLENVENFRITELLMVPPIAIALAKHPAVKNYDLSCIDSIGCGAAPLGSDISREVEKIWGGKLNLKQGWGMTEVTSSLLTWDPTEYSYSSSVGEPVANCEAKIMAIRDNSDGTESFEEITERGPEHRGELWCRGPNIMKGYWNNPTATTNTFSADSERWLRTGDEAYVDELGRFFIVDRIKELIKVKGNQVAPAELEALLLEHPAIVDVAVIGIPTPDGDEKPMAFVVKHPSLAVSVQEVEDFVKDKTVRYKWLAGGVEWTTEIPKSPSGKILRRQLREQMKEKLKQERNTAKL